MNLADACLTVIILFSVWSGWNKGFILSSMNLITWAGSVVAGFYLYSYLADFIEESIPSLSVWASPLAFILTVILARILIAAVLNTVLKATSAETHHSSLNKSLGIVPGFINGLITATIVSLLMLAFPLWDGLSAQARASLIVNKLTPPAEWLEEKLAPVFDKAVNQTMTKLTVEPDSEKTIKLLYRDTDAKLRPDLETKMLQLVNEERLKHGLKPVKADPELTEVARAHSRDMLARGYFSHYTPEGKDPFDRMRAANIRFIAAGENLAMAQTLNIAHQGLINSPGHRANILNPAFGRLGIGILDGGMYGLMISQEFRN